MPKACKKIDKNIMKPLHELAEQFSYPFPPGSFQLQLAQLCGGDAATIRRKDQECRGRRGQKCRSWIYREPARGQQRALHSRVFFYLRVRKEDTGKIGPGTSSALSAHLIHWLKGTNESIWSRPALRKRLRINIASTSEPIRKRARRRCHLNKYMDKREYGRSQRTPLINDGFSLCAAIAQIMSGEGA